MANLRVKISWESWEESEALDLTDLYPTVAVYNSPYTDGDCPIATYKCDQYSETAGRWYCGDEDSFYAYVEAYQAAVYDDEGTFDFVEGKEYVVRVYSDKSQGGDQK